LPKGRCLPSGSSNTRSETLLQTYMIFRRIAATCCAVITALTLITPCYSQSSATVRSVTPRAIPIRRLDAIMERSRDELKLPSISIAIMRGHKLVLAKAYGFADRAANSRATAHTIYAIGSLSKQFTAAAIMKLNEEGELQLPPQNDHTIQIIVFTRLREKLQGCRLRCRRNLMLS
jgi:hypothetical protein